jgi:hypothetical protein
MEHGTEETRFGLCGHRYQKNRKVIDFCAKKRTYALEEKAKL